MADQKFIEFLRELANWYEQHPLVPEPNGLNELPVFMFSVADPKEVLRSIGSFDKDFTDEYFHAIKKFGDRTLKFWINRDKVCVAKVVGTKHVERQIIPESFVPSKVIEAHEEDVVVWDCEPVLAQEPVEVGEEIR